MAVSHCSSCHSFISGVEGDWDRRDPRLSSSAKVCLFSITVSNPWLSASSVVSRLGAAIFAKLGKLGTFRSSRQIRGCRLLLQSRRCWALDLSFFFFPLPLCVIIFRCGVSPISPCFRFHCSTFCFRFIFWSRHFLCPRRDICRRLEAWSSRRVLAARLCRRSLSRRTAYESRGHRVPLGFVAHPERAHKRALAVLGLSVTTALAN